MCRRLVVLIAWLLLRVVLSFAEEPHNNSNKTVVNLASWREEVEATRSLNDDDLKVSVKLRFGVIRKRETDDEETQRNEEREEDEKDDGNNNRRESTSMFKKRMLKTKPNRT